MVTPKEREKLMGHPGYVLWFTGFSGAGKTTIAVEVEKQLNEKGYHTILLDGDIIREGLNKDLGFSKEDREENIRRLAEVTYLFQSAAVISLVSFISPYQKDRDLARQKNGLNFIEIFVDCPLDVCASRDVKGLYKKAGAGVIKNFTGIDDPYERPSNPEIILSTDTCSIKDCVNKVLYYLYGRIKSDSNQDQDEYHRENGIGKFNSRALQTH